MNIYTAAASAVESIRTRKQGKNKTIYSLPINHRIRPIVQGLALESLKRADDLLAAASSVGLLAAVQALDGETRVDADRFEKLPSFTPSSLVIVLLYEQ